MVQILSSSKKLNTGRISTLTLFSSELESLAGSWATDITLEGWELVLPGAGKMILIVPKGSLKEAFPWALAFTWSPCLLGRYRNYCNIPSLTSCSIWFHRVLQSSVICPRSWWYWQWRLWLRLMGSPPILFGHLKYDSFLILSKTWCTGSRTIVSITWVAIDPDCLAKFLRGRLLLYWFDLRDNLNLPFPLLLVFLDLLILVNTVYELTYTPNWLPGQQLPQIMLGR